MDLDDRIAVATPEGLELELTLAGAGSRFICGVTDLVIQIILAIILAVVVDVLGGGLLDVVLIIGLFADYLLYPILFEVLAAGRTPGKRLGHLRVLRADGSPVDLQASAIRNLMRLIDGETLLYLPTLISIAVTRHNQRPGDLAAGTIVVREPQAPQRPRGERRWRRRRGSDAPAIVPAARPATVAGGDGATVGGAPALDASAITVEELAAVRTFLERRATLDPQARRSLARRLAGALRERVSGAPAELGPEALLEAIVRARRG